MRLRLTVTTSATSIPWRNVLHPGRGLIYDLLANAAPELGAHLHDRGWGETGMTPFGHGAPVFPAARRRRGSYTVGGTGTWELGSPVPSIIEALAQGLSHQRVLDWGGTALRVQDIDVLPPPGFSDEATLMKTATPVVLKGSGRNEHGVRTTRQAWVLPTEPEFGAYFENNLRRKARTLGLDPDVSVEAITWVGPQRSFAVRAGAKPGSPIEAQLRGHPHTLQALWSWGLGQANSAGFGWVSA